ncbi:MAG: hypothetical protein KAI83_10190, partial [Thiomargarita sp.]|nr:hypothetical protein [Thiomargarita sp.]
MSGCLVGSGESLAMINHVITSQYAGSARKLYQKDTIDVMIILELVKQILSFPRASVNAIKLRKIYWSPNLQIWRANLQIWIISLKYQRLPNLKVWTP